MAIRNTGFNRLTFLLGGGGAMIWLQTGLPWITQLGGERNRSLTPGGLFLGGAGKC